VLVPGQFDVEVDSEGNWLMHDEGDINKPVVARMPKDGYYFDIMSMTQTDPNFSPPSLEDVRRENIFTDEELAFMQEQAERLRKKTDKALFLGAWGYFGLPIVGSIPDFLCLLLLDKSYVKDLFSVRTEVAIKNMERAKEYLGDNIDIFGLDGFDYGSQKSELFGPELFEELFLPYLKQQNEWVHRNTTWKTWQHTCGSITQILPMLVESGLDILNPVQTSAEGMEPAWLKQTFGTQLTFWGGGVDTQKTLPFGTKEEVKKEVEERIDIFGTGGGFVFNTIHNIQQNTPPENIAAAYDAVQKRT
jgi:hypothetical protein